MLPTHYPLGQDPAHWDYVQRRHVLARAIVAHWRRFAECRRRGYGFAAQANRDALDALRSVLRGEYA